MNLRYLISLLAILVVSGQSLILPKGVSQKEWIVKYTNSLYGSHYRKINGATQVAHEWKSNLEFDWPCDYVKEFYQEREQYEPGASVLTGLDFYNNETFVTVYRNEKVPAGLNKVVYKNDKSYLQPFPSLRMNEPGNCSKLIFPVTSMTDPTTGHMYVVDMGSVKIIPGSSNTSSTTRSCSPKLVVLDITKNGSVVRSHDLEYNSTGNSSFLKDIVLDYGGKEGKQVKYAYITDSGNGTILVFSFVTNKTWYFEHESMKPKASQYYITNKFVSNFSLSINNIVLSSDFELLYYSALGSLKISQISTSILRDPKGNFSDGHRYIGSKFSELDWIVSGKKGLYIGAVNMTTVYRWSASQDMQNQNATKYDVIMENFLLIYKNSTKGDYLIDTIRFADETYLFATARAPTSNTTGNNSGGSRVYKVFLNDQSIYAKK